MSYDAFWTSANRWPSDPPGWLFLGRAAIHLGDIMFDGWGQTGFAEGRRLGNLVGNLKAAQRRAARASSWTGPTPADDEPVPGEDEFQIHSDRVRTVSSQIRDWAEAGHLRTALRDTGGGKVIELDDPDRYWSTQNLAARFYCCQMRRSDPCRSAIAGEGYQHIFVHLEQFHELAAALATPAPAPAVPEAVNDVHFSPYMLLMIEVARRLAISAAAQPSVDCIKQTIADAAPSFGLEVHPKDLDKDEWGRQESPTWSPRSGYVQLSGKLFDAMPTLLREFYSPK